MPALPLARPSLAAATLLLTVGTALCEHCGLRATSISRSRPTSTKPSIRRPETMPGVEGVAHFVVNEDGIRGPSFGSDSGEYRLLAIGGSTTECAYLDEPETRVHLVGKYLDRTADGRKVWVGNVGRSGLTLSGSRRRSQVPASHLLPQYPRIDTVLTIVGINDLTVRLMRGDDYRAPDPITEARAERDRIRNAFLITPGPLHNPQSDHLFPDEAAWYNGTAIWQLLKRSKLSVQSMLAERLVQDETGQVYALWRATRRNASTRIDAYRISGARSMSIAAI